METHDPAPPWLREVAQRHAAARHGSDRCLGSVGLIDATARMRGVASVVDGTCVALGRPVVSGPVVRHGDGRSTFGLEVYVETTPGLLVGSDRVELDAHGLSNTHLDGLTHIGLDGTWHGGVPHDSVFRDDDSLSAWARHGIVTRGVLVDLPAHRGVPCVANTEPVRGAEIEACLAASAVKFEAGDALLLYQGRDRFEEAGDEYPAIADAADGRPGVHASGAEWMADNDVGVLCWDFLDAHGGDNDPLSVHLLIWAIGLALIDNCDLGAAARTLWDAGRSTGLLAVAPLDLPRATGCMVNPLFVV